MAIIFKQTYVKDVLQQPEPVTYVDSIIPESYVAEMYNIAVRYIRETVSINSIFPVEVKREKHMAKDVNDVYYNKKDNFYIIGDEKNRTITLVKRYTVTGIIYNSTYVEKIFTLTCKNCPRIVPQLQKISSKFEMFGDELKQRVTEHAGRTGQL